MAVVKKPLFEQFKGVKNLEPWQVKLLREKAGLTQQEAAELIGVSLRAWQYYEQESYGEKEISRKMKLIYAELFAERTNTMKELKQMLRKET